MITISLPIFLYPPSTPRRTPPPPATTEAKIPWGSSGAIIAPDFLPFARLRDAQAPKMAPIDQKKLALWVKIATLLPENRPTNATKSFARIFSILFPISNAYG